MSPPLQQDALEEARCLGRLEAESYDLSLREREGREREERFARLVVEADDTWDIGDAWDNGTISAGDNSSTIWRLQQDLERFAGFHRAVLNSKAWRFIQALRRPFGRAW